MPAAESLRPTWGCIADDFTGATDLAGLMARSGIRVIQTFGVPARDLPLDSADAIVVALKSRSIASQEAIQQSLQACDWLRQLGVRSYFFKYCSTFDSTDQGNIGPVAEALMQHLDIGQTVFCPGFPENGRTVFNGHLFVGDQLISESGMQHHPLNPMTDPDLRRVLTRQSRQPVGCVTHELIDAGADAVKQAMSRLPPLVICDTTRSSDLATLAEAFEGHRLVTGGSAIAGALVARATERSTEQTERVNSPPVRPVQTEASTPGAIIAGSCSLATQAQIKAAEPWCQHLAIDILAVDRAMREASQESPLQTDVYQAACHWIQSHIDGAQPLMLSTTADAETLQSIHQRVGRERAADIAERILGELAAQLVAAGVRRLVVAGGETSGSVTQRLGIDAIQIGNEIAPGVPWTYSVGEPSIALALKSGNFGGESFFQDALG